MRSIRNVRSVSVRWSVAVTYQLPRSAYTWRGVITRSVESSRDALQYVMRNRSSRRAASATWSAASGRSRSTSSPSPLPESTLASPPSAAASLTRPRPRGPDSSAPGNSIAARPAASNSNASVEFRRSGLVNNRGTPTKTVPSSMNTSINSSTNGGSPHIATSSRSAATSSSVRRKRSATSASGTSPRSISHGSMTRRRRSRSSAPRCDARHQPAT